MHETGSESPGQGGGHPGSKSVVATLCVAASGMVVPGPQCDRVAGPRRVGRLRVGGPRRIIPSHHHGGAAAAEPGVLPPTWSLDAVHWSFMVLAMMLPLVLGPIRATARRSLWYRRDRAIGGFLVGYLGPWLLIGLFASAPAAALSLDGRSYLPALAALGFAVAAAWQLTPIRRRALWSCHRTAPLAPHGWRADRDCIRYGWEIGRSGLVSCWAMMDVGFIGATERYATRPRRPVIAGALAGLALVYATLALSR